MGNVADLVRYREEAVPHIVSEVICVKCMRRWLCVRPEATRLKDIECQSCGPGFVIETGQRVDS